MRHDQRQRILMPRPHVDEVDVHPVDLGHKLRHRVELGFGLAPVVLFRPVARERLHRRQLDALRPIGDQLPRGPARRTEANAQRSQLLLRDLDPKRADTRRFRRHGQNGRP
jgi:hypothetical protein